MTAFSGWKPKLRDERQAFSGWKPKLRESGSSQMGGLATREVTIIRPRSEPKSGEDLQRDRSETDEISVRAWLKQLSGERALSVLGQLTTKAYKCRFAKPREMEHEIAVGWRVRDEEGHEYEVLGVVRTGRAYDLMLERV